MMDWNKDDRTLLAIPAALLAFSLILTNAHGPYFLAQNFDPEYAYLFNSLNLLSFHFPAHIDHPGTTLQVLGAIVVLGRWLTLSVFSPTGSLTASVLASPEEYLRTINLALNLLFSGFLYLVARQVFRHAGSLLPALVLQVSFVLVNQALLAQTRVSPEPLLLTAALAMMWPLIPLVMGERQAMYGLDRKLALLAGAAFGFGVVTKVTFLPLGALVLLFPSNRQKLRFFGSAAGTAALLLLPVATQLPKMAGWFWALAIHRGQYGSGGIGIPGLAAVADRLTRLIGLEPVVFMLVGLYAGLLGGMTFRPGREADPRMVSARRLLGAGLLAIGALVLLTLKHYAPHYALPAMALVPLLNASVVGAFEPRVRRPQFRLAVVAAAVCFLGGGLLSSATQIGRWTRYWQFNQEQIDDQVRIISDLDQCSVAGIYRSSLPSFALFFGNRFSNRFHQNLLAELYPNGFHYERRTGHFESFAGEQIDDRVALDIRNGRCVLIQGETSSIQQIDGLRFDMLSTPGAEQLVRVLNIPPGRGRE